MFKVIYDSDEWVVRKDENGNLEVTNFMDEHWHGALHIEQDEIWEE